MPALFQSSLKTRLLGAAFACLAAVGMLTTSAPAFAEAGAPAVSLSRTAEVAPQATPGQVAQPANIGNPQAIAGSEKRIALVIGNSAYENVTKLTNPANDAREIGKFLNKAGFEVIQATDLDHDEMIQVLQDFSAKIAERGPNTAVFVYYAGHGLQIAGDNYLVPVDAKINSEADVASEAIRLVDVMATLQAVPSRIRMAVFDSCRDNPFTELKDAGRGLAIVDAPNGSIVAYSTAPGTQALDGDGKNSPYAEAFLRLGPEQNLPIEQFFKKVRVVVNDITDGKQTPWESSSLTSDFYFFGDTAIAAAKTIDPSVAQANASANRPVQLAQASQAMRTRSSRDAYNIAIAEGSTEYYQEYVRLYPYDPYADRIRRLLAARLISIAWHAAVVANTTSGYQTFYSQYSDSPYGNLAQKLAFQPKAFALYQPTKIMVAPQIAPQIKLTNFNGVNVGQGNNAPIGLGGNGSLFNKKFGNGGQGNGGFGGIGNGGIGQKIGGIGNGGGQGNGGFGNGGVGNVGNVGNVGQKVGLPGNGPGNPINTGINGGQVSSLPNGQNKPGIDLAKNVKRIDAKIDNGRVTTLPTGQNGKGGPIGPLTGKDGKVLTGNTGINGGHVGTVGSTGNTGNTGNTGINGGRIGNVGNVGNTTGNTGINPKVGYPGRVNQTGVVNQVRTDRPVFKRVEQPRVISAPVKQTYQTPVVKRYNPSQKLYGNGGNGGNGGFGGGNGGVIRSKPMSFGGGGGGGGGNRFAGGGGGGFRFR